jgi:hypothetical protein
MTNSVNNTNIYLFYEVVIISFTSKESDNCPWAGFSFVPGILAPSTNEGICTGWKGGAPMRPGEGTFVPGLLMPRYKCENLTFVPGCEMTRYKCNSHLSQGNTTTTQISSLPRISFFYPVPPPHAPHTYCNSLQETI